MDAIECVEGRFAEGRIPAILYNGNVALLSRAFP